MPTLDIMNLDEMDRFIDNTQRSNFFDSRNVKRKFSNIKDEGLKFIDGLLDDNIINRLLSYEGYSPCMRDVYPSNFFRAELLKTMRCPEISYRKFCQKEYMGLDRKQNREFIGLPLHKKLMIHHTQLSQFRASMTFTQMANLLVYVLSQFLKSGDLNHGVLQDVDFPELPNDSTHPLFSINVNCQKIRIYADVDSDYGAGNYQDSLFVRPLIKLAQAVGVEVELFTADGAYQDQGWVHFQRNGSSPDYSAILAV